VSVLFPFHTTHAAYADEQTRLYHDQSECSEAKKIQWMHRTEGSGGRRSVRNAPVSVALRSPRVQPAR